MRRILLLFFTVLIAFSGLQAHPFHVSVTELNYKKDVKAWQISSKIFIDDLELAMESFAGKKLDLGTQGEADEADEWIAKYLRKNLKVFLNDEQKDFLFLGKESEGDAFWIYLEIANVPIPDQLKIWNSVLTDVYDDQVNLVHVNMPGFKKSFRFSGSDKEFRFL